MIQANELRVGNLVNEPMFEGKVRVKAIEGGTYDKRIMMVEITDNKSVGESSIEGIPITSIILTVCGFESIGFGGYWVHTVEQYFSIKWDESTQEAWAALYAHNLWFGRSFKYLHQLQNLFHSMTNEELQIDLCPN